MKEIKELKFEELTIEQKLGLVVNINMNMWQLTPEWKSFFLDHLKKKSGWLCVDSVQRC